MKMQAPPTATAMALLILARVMVSEHLGRLSLTVPDNRIRMNRLVALPMPRTPIFVSMICDDMATSVTFLKVGLVGPTGTEWVGLEPTYGVIRGSP